MHFKSNAHRRAVFAHLAKKGKIFHKGTSIIAINALHSGKKLTLIGAAYSPFKGSDIEIQKKTSPLTHIEAKIIGSNWKKQKLSLMDDKSINYYLSQFNKIKINN